MKKRVSKKRPVNKKSLKKSVKKRTSKSGKKLVFYYK